MQGLRRACAGALTGCGDVLQEGGVRGDPLRSGRPVRRRPVVVLPDCNGTATHCDTNELCSCSCVSCAAVCVACVRALCAHGMFSTAEPQQQQTAAATDGGSDRRRQRQTAVAVVQPQQQQQQTAAEKRRNARQRRPGRERTVNDHCLRREARVQWLEAVVAIAHTCGAARVAAATEAAGTTWAETRCAPPPPRVVSTCCDWNRWGGDGPTRRVVLEHALRARSQSTDQMS